MSSPNQIVVSQVNDVTTVEITTAGPQGATGAAGPQGPQVSDGDKGDITVSNSGGTYTIDDDVVTYAKIQNVSATDRVLGRDSSGAGVIEEITPANLRTMINVEDGATGDMTDAEIKTAYENNSDTNAFTDTEKSKLAAIEASADVTDSTNVDAAGAVMNSDLDGKGELLVGDGSGDPTALPAGTNGYVLKANSSTATGLEWSAAGSGGEANQNAFSNIGVSGQDTVAADSTTDTLNIAAGSNVTITTNASNDTVTIASTDTNTTYSVGDGGLTQNNFTDTLKTKLDGIAASANNYSISSDLLDEDNMASNSATKVPSQQSVKAYVDANSSDTTYTAGTGLSLSGTTFNVDQIALTTVQTAANESAQLALTTQEGDIVVRSDQNKSYVRNSGTAGTMADFTELLTPTDQVLSVNGNTGAISAAQIAAAVEAASDSNTFTDADHTKLDGIEASADVTDATNVAASGAAMLTGAAFTGDISVTSTDTGSSASPEVELYRNSASPADADYLGQLKFTGESDDGSKEVYAKLTGKIDDASSGTEDGLIQFALRKAGSNNIGARLTSTDLKLINGTGLEVAGNISCDGTVDGVDIAALNTTVGNKLGNVVEDTTPQLGGNLDVLANEITTTTTNGNIKLNPNGTGVVEVKGDGSSADGTLQLNCSQNSHGVKIKSPAHSAGASYTLTLPDDTGSANQVLKTNGSGVLDWVDQTTDTNTTYSAGSGLSLSGTTFSVDTLNQNTTGSAATLTTPRAINGVNFDGSADITIADSTKIATAGGTFTGSVIFEDAINETIFAISDASSVALDPDNGMIQTWTLGANRTATDSLTTGQSVLLMITAGSNTLTWPTITWAGGSAPTLSTSSVTAIELWKVGSTLYGANVGDV